MKSILAFFNRKGEDILANLVAWAIQLILGLLIIATWAFISRKWDVLGLEPKLGIVVTVVVYLLLIIGSGVVLYRIINIIMPDLHREGRKGGKEKVTPQEPPEYAKLGRLRTEGVRLRNEGRRLPALSALPEWIAQYTKWDKKVLSTLRRLSKGKSEWLRTLDGMPIDHSRKALSEDHLRYLSIFDEKLRRLDMILRTYLNLPLE